jgi:transposase InsO family protein
MEDIEIINDQEEHRTAIALFRHSLVASLASSSLGPGELTHELRKIARRRHKIPGSRRSRVSVSSLRRWRAAYCAGGLEALKPGLRSDYGSSRVICQPWRDRAIALRQELPSRTSRVITEILATQPDCPTINPHTLDKMFRRLGMTRRQLRKPKPRTRRWSARNVNDLWQGDATPGVWLPDPRDPAKKVQTTLFLWIDDVSRLVPYAEFFFDERLPRMERTLKLAILRRGLPACCYTDNGNVYIAFQYKAMLAELGIKPTHSRKKRPQGRGKVERIFQTLQTDFYPEVYKAKLQTMTELNEALWAWLERIYHKRIHSETKLQPLKAYRAAAESIRVADAGAVARAFLWRYTRLISSNGYLSLLGNSYSVDPAWGGRKIELRCDPFDLSRIDVYQDCRPVAKAHVRNLKRARLIELEPLVPPPDVEPSGISFLDVLRREHRLQVAAEIGAVSFRRAFQREDNRS